MKPKVILGTIAFITALSLCGCAGVNKHIMAKQGTGINYPVPYQMALQSTLSALTKKGITINTIDKGNGLITTSSQQIREENYVYQIVIRPVGPSETAISVRCNWSVSPRVDEMFLGMPSGIARSKSKDLEKELADDIRKEMTMTKNRKNERTEPDEVIRGNSEH